MSDALIRGIFSELGLRFAYCVGAGLANEGIRRHRADALSGQLLSEALVAAAMLSTNLKSEERLTLRWMYPGPIGTIMADVNDLGEVRGFPQRLTLLPGVSTIEQAIGEGGRISGVTSLPNRVGRTGITEAVFRNVSLDLGFFLSLSFQVETGVAVGVTMLQTTRPNVAHATGLLLQPLPGARLDRFDRFRVNMESAAFREWLGAAPRTLEETLDKLEIGEAPQQFQEYAPVYKCRCSKEKVESVLRILDPSEIQEMLEQEGMAQVNCHFCAEIYTFTAVDLQIIIENSRAGTA